MLQAGDFSGRHGPKEHRQLSEGHPPAVLVEALDSLIRFGISNVETLAWAAGLEGVLAA